MSNNWIVDTAKFDDDDRPTTLGDNPNPLLFMTLHLNLTPPCLHLLLLFGNNTGGCLLIPTNSHPSQLPPLLLHPHLSHEWPHSLIKFLLVPGPKQMPQMFFGNSRQSLRNGGGEQLPSRLWWRVQRLRKPFFNDIITGSLTKDTIEVVQGTTSLARGIFMIPISFLFYFYHMITHP